MPIEPVKRRALPAAAAMSIICLALVSGCSSAAKSTGVSSPGGANQPAAAGGTSAAAAAGGGSGSFKSACPSTSVVAADLGYTFPAPTQTGSDDNLLCSYSDAAGDNLVIVFAPLPGGTPAMLKLAMDGQAQGQNATDTPVPGLGDAAFMFGEKDGADNPDKVNTTILAVLVGSEDVDITATAPAAKVEALARSIIGG